MPLGGGFVDRAASDEIGSGMGIDVFRLDDACCYERGHDRVILCDLLESRGFAIEVEPTIAHMRYVGGGIHDQGCRHRRAHIVSLLPVVPVHQLVGILHACGEQGQKVLWLPRLPSHRATYIVAQSLHTPPAASLSL